MRAVCFGDSNTYGFDPRSYIGGRYPEDIRWVSVLEKLTGWEIDNQGLNGREIPDLAADFSPEPDILIIMLGTNDLLQGCSCEKTADKMEKFISSLGVQKERILLISPPAMSRGAWVYDEGLIEDSLLLSDYYRSVAEKTGVFFADAAKWRIKMTFDGVHFTEEGHRCFAENLFEQVKSMGLN